jgi:hypothetical protein
MLPQMRQIQRFVVEVQSTQWDSEGVDGFVNGIGTEDRELADVG